MNTNFTNLNYSEMNDINGGAIPASALNPGPAPKMSDYDLTTQEGRYAYGMDRLRWELKVSQANNILFFGRVTRGLVR